MLIGVSCFGGCRCLVFVGMCVRVVLCVWCFVLLLLCVCCWCGGSLFVVVLIVPVVLVCLLLVCLCLMCCWCLGGV